MHEANKNLVKGPTTRIIKLSKEGFISPSHQRFLSTFLLIPTQT